MEFGCIDEAFNFYSQYALSSGFEPRRFSHRTAKDDFGVQFVKYKWIVCSREGSKRKRRSDSKQSRNRPTQRTSCEACILIVFNAEEASIGPSVGYRILTKIHGGHEAVGASKTDCLFWADEVSKLNYYALGMLYLSMNLPYDMVFIPFAGIDNHKKCVTFGAGMLAKEDISSYKWLLNEFKNAFPREPKVVLTDQDPSMKVAVSDVFKTARHRLCMWHIMEKVPVKVSHIILKSGLRGDLLKIVWTDKINKEEFDKQWLHVLTKYDADENKWLNDMYKLRYNWIPTYFQDWEMSGLMRTSSSQRWVQSENDQKSMYTTLDLATEYALERHAHTLFTHDVILDIQKEMCEAFKHCLCFNVSELTDGSKTFSITDTSVKSCDIDDSIDRDANPNYFDELVHRHSQVTFNFEDKVVTCSCKKFERCGIFCKHIYYVLRLCGVEEIPDEYLADPAKLVQFRDTLEELKKKAGDDMGSKPPMGSKEFMAAMTGLPQPSSNEVTNPQNIRNKGCGTKRRLKSDREEAILKEKNWRNCAYCKSLQQHDIRTCPIRIKAEKLEKEKLRKK
uniref:protein FAR1-RELATED SEQUENCE 5-like n=1 Tax=Erigeron canadensis TaxID=72917 RepID=UPI001CB9C451|nr:protein FAR1-RELATED SEQUENCE 5-like [Erigeron canadensis]